MIEINRLMLGIMMNRVIGENIRHPFRQGLPCIIDVAAMRVVHPADLDISDINAFAAFLPAALHLDCRAGAAPQKGFRKLRHR